MPGSLLATRLGHVQHTYGADEPTGITASAIAAREHALLYRIGCANEAS